ncbi:hypothetical protein WL857_28150 [Escherichia coli]
MTNTTVMDGYSPTLTCRAKWFNYSLRGLPVISTRHWQMAM